MTEVEEEVKTAEVKAEEVKTTEAKVEEKKPEFRRFRRQGRKKVCAFCVNKSKVIDYKDVAMLRHYISERGKILPRRQTGTCSMHQRMVANAIKKARIMALLPFKAD